VTIARVPLSRSETGKAWLAQFKSADDVKAASKLLDAMLLLNDAEVADAIRDGIDRLLGARRCHRRKSASALQPGRAPCPAHPP
jgi:hypothetical protein